MMPPTDRLSDLPENVMNAILMPLPFREAVRTSILSNKWRYKWCRLPQLTLNDDLWKPTHSLLTPSIKFTNVMYPILTLHSGPLTKFTLSISKLKKYPMIGSLIYFLSRNDIQHLVLQFSEWNRYKLPPSFFTFSQLRHLTLKNCVVCPPPGFKGFDMLISLELRDVTISTELLESLISYSPLLENLVLQISDAFSHIQISASKLRTFALAGCLKFISLEDVPLLAKLSLLYHTSPENFEICDLDSLFQSIPALEHLCLEDRSLRSLDTGAAGVPRRLSSPLNYLKRLNMVMNNLVDLSCALCLIRSSPYLQDIEVELDGWYDPVDVDVVDAEFSDVTLNNLRTIKLTAFNSTNLLMQFIKHLLAKSPMLVRMVIMPYESDEDYEDLRDKVLPELTGFHQASPKAEVVVLEYEW